MNLGNKCFLNKYVKGRIEQINGKIATVNVGGVPIHVPVPPGHEPGDPIDVTPGGGGTPLTPPLNPPEEPIPVDDDKLLFRVLKGGKFHNFRNKYITQKTAFDGWDGFDYVYVATTNKGKIVGAIKLVNVIPNANEGGTSAISEFIPPKLPEGDEVDFKNPLLKTYAKAPYVVSTNILPNTKTLTEDYEKGYNDILIDWGHTLVSSGYDVDTPDVNTIYNSYTDQDERSISNSILIDGLTNTAYYIEETLIETPEFWKKSSDVVKEVTIAKIERDENGLILNTYSNKVTFNDSEYSFFEKINPNGKFIGKDNFSGYLAGTMSKNEESIAVVYYPHSYKDMEEMSNGDLKLLKSEIGDIRYNYIENTITEVHTDFEVDDPFQKYLDSKPELSMYEVDNKQFETVEEAEEYCELEEIPTEEIEEITVSKAFYDIKLQKYVKELTDYIILLLTSEVVTDNDTCIIQAYNFKRGQKPILDYTSSTPVIINYNQFVYKDSLYDLSKLTLDGYSDESTGIPTTKDDSALFYGFGKGRNFWSSGNFATENAMRNNGLKIKTMTDYSLEDFMNSKEADYRKLLELYIPDVYELNDRLEKGEEPIVLESSQNLDEKLDYLTFAEVVKSSAALRSAFSGTGEFGELITNTYIPYDKEDRRDYTLYDDKDMMREFYYSPEVYPEDVDSYLSTQERPKIRNIKCLKIDGNEEDIYTFMFDKKPIVLEEDEEEFDNTPLSMRLFVRDQVHKICYETVDGIVVTELERYDIKENEEIKFPREDLSFITLDLEFDPIEEVYPELHDVTISFEEFGEEYFTEGIDYTVDYETAVVTFIDSGTENWAIGYYEIIMFDGDVEEDTFEDEVIPVFLVNGEVFEDYDLAKNYCIGNEIPIIDIIFALKVWIFNKYYVNYKSIANLSNDQRKDKQDDSIQLSGYDFYVRYGSKYFAYLLGTSDKNPAEGEEDHIPEEGYKIQKYNLALDILSDAETFDDFSVIKIGDMTITTDEDNKIYYNFGTESPVEITSDLITEYSNILDIESIGIENYLKNKINVVSYIDTEDENKLKDVYYLVHELDNDYVEDNEDILHYIYCFNDEVYKIVKGYPVIASVEDKKYIYTSKWEATDELIYIIDTNIFDTLEDAETYCDDNTLEYDLILETNKIIPDGDTGIDKKLFILSDTITEVDISENEVQLTGFELYKDVFFNRYDYDKEQEGLIFNTQKELLEAVQAEHLDEESDNYIEILANIEIDNSSILIKDSIEKLPEYTVDSYIVGVEEFETLEDAQIYCTDNEIDFGDIVVVPGIVDIKGFWKERPITDEGKVLDYYENVEVVEDIPKLDFYKQVTFNEEFDTQLQLNSDYTALYYLIMDIIISFFSGRNNFVWIIGASNELYLARDPQNNDAYFASNEEGASTYWDYTMMQYGSPTRIVTGSQGHLNKNRDKIYTYVARTYADDAEYLSWVVEKDLKATSDSITITQFKGEGMGEYPYRAIRTVENEDVLMNSPAIIIDAPIFSVKQGFWGSLTPGYVYSTAYEDITVTLLYWEYGTMIDGIDYTVDSENGEVTMLAGHSTSVWFNLLFTAPPTSNNREEHTDLAIVWDAYVGHGIIGWWDNELFKDVTMQWSSDYLVSIGYPEGVTAVWIGYTVEGSEEEKYSFEMQTNDDTEFISYKFGTNTGSIYYKYLLVDFVIGSLNTGINVYNWQINQVTIPAHQYYKNTTSHWLEYIDENGSVIEEEVLIDGIGSVLVGNPLGIDDQYHKVSLKFGEIDISLEYDGAVQRVLSFTKIQAMLYIDNYTDRRIINTKNKVYLIEYIDNGYNFLELYPNYGAIKIDLWKYYYIIEDKILFYSPMGDSYTGDPDAEPDLYMYDTITEQEYIITGSLPSGYMQVSYFQFVQKLDKNRYILFGAYDAGGTISHPEYCVLIYWDSISESYKYESVFDGTIPYSWMTVRRIMGTHKGKILIRFTENSTLVEGEVVDGDFLDYRLYDVDTGVHTVITRQDGEELIGNELRISFDASKLINQNISEDPSDF